MNPVLLRFPERTFRAVSLLFFAAGPLVFCACVNQKKIVFHPEPQSGLKQTGTVGTGEIIESRNGPAGAPMPEWVNRFYHGGVRHVETLDIYRDKYVFIGENRGANLNALRQWAERFTAAQDFPRLAAARVESRLFAAASLYPDDEYGEFFEAVIKSVSDAEYPEAVKENSFWVKRRISGNDEAMPDLYETAETENTAGQEIYEFLVLISIDKIVLRDRIQEQMAKVQTNVSPTRDQAESINRVRQYFFEDF